MFLDSATLKLICSFDLVEFLPLEVNNMRLMECIRLMCVDLSFLVVVIFNFYLTTIAALTLKTSFFASVSWQT